MTPAVIAALATGIGGIITATFTGIALLIHAKNPDAHQAPTLEGKP